MGLLFIKTSNDFSGVFDALHQVFGPFSDESYHWNINWKLLWYTGSLLGAAASLLDIRQLRGLSDHSVIFW